MTRAVIFWLCIAAAGHAAAADSVAIRRATYFPPGAGVPAQVEVVFEAEFTTTTATGLAADSANYRIVDVDAAPKPVAITAAVIQTAGNQTKERMNTVYLQLAAPLTAASKRYVVVVSKLTFGEDAVPVDNGPALVHLDSEPFGTLTRTWKSAKDRDASDVYFAGSISNSKSEKYYGSADIKLRVPMWSPERWNRVHYLAPSLDLQASGSPDADPDSIKGGFSWMWFPWTLVQWENVPEFESTKDFGLTDFVWRSELTFLPHSFKAGTAQLWITPLVGVALGRIADIPEDETALRKGPIARVMAGASATLKFPVFFAKSASVTAKYELRHLGYAEPTEGDVLAAGDHHWAEAKAEVGFNDFVSLAVGFQDGQQPPKYKAVNRALTVDLVLKAKRSNKKATD